VFSVNQRFWAFIRFFRALRNLEKNLDFLIGAFLRLKSTFSDYTRTQFVRDAFLVELSQNITAKKVAV
jgi:hypothetical protein